MYSSDRTARGGTFASPTVSLRPDGRKQNVGGPRTAARNRSGLAARASPRSGARFPGDPRVPRIQGRRSAVATLSQMMLTASLGDFMLRHGCAERPRRERAQAGGPAAAADSLATPGLALFGVAVGPLSGSGRGRLAWTAVGALMVTSGARTLYGRLDAIGARKPGEQRASAGHEPAVGTPRDCRRRARARLDCVPDHR